MSQPPCNPSRTPLATKLGITAGSRIVVIEEPRDYAALIGTMPSGVIREPKVTPETTLVHLFSREKAHLQRELEVLRRAIASTTVVWVSWPKKTSGVKSDITDNTIRDVALPLGFVDIKVCSVSDVWSGLKLVIRRTLR